MVPRKVFVVGVQLLGVVIGTFSLASPSNGGVPSSARGDRAAPALFGGSSSSSDDRSIGSVLPAEGSLSSPTSGQISFRAKTGNGVRGVVPHCRMVHNVFVGCHIVLLVQQYFGIQQCITAAVLYHHSITAVYHTCVFPSSLLQGCGGISAVGVFPMYAGRLVVHIYI